MSTANYESVNLNELNKNELLNAIYYFDSSSKATTKYDREMLLDLATSKQAKANAEIEAKQNARAAETARKSENKANQKKSQTEKRLNSLHKILNKNSTGLVEMIAQQLIENPSLSEYEVRSRLGIDSKQNGYCNAVKATLRCLYQRGMLDMGIVNYWEMQTRQLDSDE